MSDATKGRGGAVEALLRAPYGHDVRRDGAGNTHLSLYNRRDERIVTLVAPTFDEAVFRALEIAAQERSA